MDDIKFIGNNHAEDVKWLYSLSESELDMLISLKKLALQRAKVVGHESLAQKFDLKMLRALGFVMMQVTKRQVNGLQLTGSNELDALFDSCNLLKLDTVDRRKTREQPNTEQQATTTEQANTEDQATATEQANTEKQANIGEQDTARSNEVAVKLKRKREHKKADSELSRRTSKD